MTNRAWKSYSTLANDNPYKSILPDARIKDLRWESLNGPGRLAPFLRTLVTSMFAVGVRRTLP